jgi:hypothetical protein
MSAETEDGLWCKECRKRHGYMTMNISWEKRDGVWVSLWTCPTYFNVLGETRG